MKLIILATIALLFVSVCTAASYGRDNTCSWRQYENCIGAALNCGNLCDCNITSCNCCLPCIICVTTMFANCCPCLFPGWSACNNNAVIRAINTTAMQYRTLITVINNNPNVCVYNDKLYPCDSYIWVWKIGPYKCSCKVKPEWVLA